MIFDSKYFGEFEYTLSKNNFEGHSKMGKVEKYFFQESKIGIRANS